MADPRVIQEIILKGAEAVERALDRVGDAGERAFNRLEAGAARLKGLGSRFFNLGPVEQQLKNIENASNKFGGALRNLGNAAVFASGHLAKLGAIIGVGGPASLAVAFAKLTTSATASAAAVKDAAGRTGLTTQEFQKLKFAFEQAGQSGETLERAMGFIGDAITQAQEQGKESIDGFERMGIALTEMGGKARKPLDILLDVSDKLSKIEDPAERAQKAIDVFGRRLGPSLVEPLADGVKGLNALAVEASQAGFVLTKLQIQIADEFDDKLNKFKNTLLGVRDAVGIVFAPGLGKGLDILQKGIEQNRTALIAMASDIATKVTPVITDFALALSGRRDEIKLDWVRNAVEGFIQLGESIKTVVENVIIPAFKLLMAAFQIAAEAINGLFGTKITGTDIAVFLIITKLIGAFGLLTGAIKVVITALNVFRVALVPLIASFGPWGIVIAAVALAIGFLLSKLTPEQWKKFGEVVNDVWTNIKKGFDGVVEWIKQKASDVWEWLIATWNASWFGQTVNAIVNIWNGGLDALSNAWSRMLDWVQQKLEAMATYMEGTWLGAVIRSINTAIDGFRRLARAISNAHDKDHPDIPETHTGLATEARARGGWMRGAGTGTSDSILSWLSDGEYVVRAAVAKKWGPLMDAINSGRIGPDSLLGMATGGLVRAVRHTAPSGVPRYQTGGPAEPPSPGRALTLTIGTETFEGLIAPEHTAERIVRYAVRQQVRSGGRKPTYYGGGR